MTSLTQTHDLWPLFKVLLVIFQLCTRRHSIRLEKMILGCNFHILGIKTTLGQHIARNLPVYVRNTPIHITISVHGQGARTCIIYSHNTSCMYGFVLFSYVVIVSSVIDQCHSKFHWLESSRLSDPMGFLSDTQNCGLRKHRECRERFENHRLQRNPLISYSGMYHGTCVTHVPWCMSGSLTEVTGKAFQAHAQPSILRTLQEAHASEVIVRGRASIGR